MSETLDKKLDNMEEVTKALTLSPRMQNLVNPSTPLKVALLRLLTLTLIRMEGAKGTKNAGALHLVL